MAKKNSTKEATQKALSSSEPKVQLYSAWTGMNIQQQPLLWAASDDDENQTDLVMNHLVIQNNVVTTSMKTLETRGGIELIANAPSLREYTGVACLCGSYLICAVRNPVTGAEYLYYRSIGASGSWSNIAIQDADAGGLYIIKSINYYAGQLIILTAIDYAGVAAPSPWGHEIFTGTFRANGTPPTSVASATYVDTPTEAADVSTAGDVTFASEAEALARITICYAYVNKFGSTLPGPTKTVFTSKIPAEWNYSDYLIIGKNVDGGNSASRPSGIIAVDVYASMDDSTDFIFIGRAPLIWRGTTWAWSCNWLGAMSDTSEWTNVSLSIPTENTTKGVNASYMSHHDGRLYFYKGDIPYRLWVGGNPGSELSVSRGLGGGFVDVEPGTGMEINKTLKFKTYNGASIVTLMCGNENASQVKRHNLLESNIALTNEISSRGYIVEEVSNVVGSNSPWGSGVFADGLYTISRYGLVITTQAMESSNQLRAQYVSDAIEPIFNWRLANRLKNCRMICIKDIIYIVLADDVETEEVPTLDSVLLCYDIALKAWYTHTLEIPAGESILHIMALDHEDHHEGIGVITDTKVYILPTTGRQDADIPTFDIQLETGELAIKQPLQATNYLCQVEIAFDYFIGDATVTLKGTDYYGRQVTITKQIHHASLVRNLQEFIRVDLLMRSYNLTITGKARMRLTHILGKSYLQSRKINLVYGHDVASSYVSADGTGTGVIHHAIDSYNNLREAILP